jgi:DNA primase
VPVFEFAIRSELARHNLETNEGRLAALDDAAQIVGRIKDPGLRDRYGVSLDRWLGMMDEDFVLQRVREHSGPAAAGGRAQGRRRPPAGNGAAARSVPQPRDGDAPPYNMRDPVTQIEREALKLAVQRPALCGPAFDALGAGCFTAAAVHSAAFSVISSCGGAVTAAGGGREWAEQLRNAAPDEAVRAFITQLAVEPARAPRADGEPDARYASEVLARVEELAVSRQIAAIKSRLQRLNPVTEQGEYNKMFGDLVALEQRRKVLSGPAADAV